MWGEAPRIQDHKQHHADVALTAAVLYSIGRLSFLDSDPDVLGTMSDDLLDVFLFIIVVLLISSYGCAKPLAGMKCWDVPGGMECERRDIIR